MKSFDAIRYLTLTNLGPGASQPISIWSLGMHGGQYADLMAIGESHGGLNGCFEGQSLAVGAQCSIHVSWAPRNRSTTDMTGVVEIRLWNTTTVLASVPVSAAYQSRAYITGGLSPASLTANQGFKQRGDATLTNVGDSPATPSVSVSGPDAQFFAVDSNRENTCEGFSIAVDATCKLPIVFCAGVVRDYEASLVVTVNNVVTESSPLRATVRQLNDHPQCTHLQTND